jgi:hypothetical protein
MAFANRSRIAHRARDLTATDRRIQGEDCRIRTESRLVSFDRFWERTRYPGLRDGRGALQATCFARTRGKHCRRHLFGGMVFMLSKRNHLERRACWRPTISLPRNSRHVGHRFVQRHLLIYYHMRDPIKALSAAASVTKNRLIVETHVDHNDIERPIMRYVPLFPGRRRRIIGDRIPPCWSPFFVNSVFRASITKWTSTPTVRRTDFSTHTGEGGTTGSFRLRGLSKSVFPCGVLLRKLWQWNGYVTSRARAGAAEDPAEGNGMSSGRQVRYVER